MLTLTDTASTKVKELIQAEDNPELVLRVAVRPGGCSGPHAATAPQPAGLTLAGPTQQPPRFVRRLAYGKSD